MHFESLIRKTQVLLESAKPEPVAHLPHLEDLSIESGKEGFAEFLMHVGEVLKRVEGLESEQHIGEKIDGSMTVYFGTDPRPKFKGQFSVATKSALSKEPKLVHNLDEIATLYPDKGEAFKQHLTEVFINLQKAYDYSGKIYMGDLLFSNPEQKKTTEIDGTSYLYFKPNTVIYAVEEDPKSDLFNRLKEASLGIFIHDSFTADSKDGKLVLHSAGKNVDALIQKGKEANVFIEGSHIENLSLKVPKKTYQELQSLAKKASKEVENITPEFNEYWINSPILGRLKKYINQQVHLPTGGIFGNGGRSFNAYKIIEEFIPFVHGSYKNPKNAALASKPLKEQESQFVHLLNSFHWMLQTKNALLDLFDQIGSKIGQTFIEQEDGSFIPTRGEGFVFMHQGKYTKLVDRLSFTKNNKLFGRFNESLNIILEAINPTIDGWISPAGELILLNNKEQHIDAASHILEKYFSKQYDPLTTLHWDGYELLLKSGFGRGVEGSASEYYIESVNPPNIKQKRELVNLCIENKLNKLIWDSAITQKPHTIWQSESSGDS